MGRIRQALVDLKGDQCHACGLRTGVIVDHDHVTGFARGLLCSHRNVWIDECSHLDDCPWAAYLNNPPAADLRLRHPGAHNDRKLNQARISGLRPHRLRHTYGTRLRQNGADVAQVQALLNHASIETSSRYFRAGPKEQAAVVESTFEQ